MTGTDNRKKKQYETETIRYKKRTKIRISSGASAPLLRIVLLYNRCREAKAHTYIFADLDDLPAAPRHFLYMADKKISEPGRRKASVKDEDNIISRSVRVHDNHHTCNQHSEPNILMRRTCIQTERRGASIATRTGCGVIRAAVCAQVPRRSVPEAPEATIRPPRSSHTPLPA